MRIAHHVARTLAAITLSTGLAVAAAQPAHASPQTNCFGQDRALLCITWDTDASQLPTVDLDGQVYLGCYYVGGETCVPVYAPQPITNIGNPTQVVTMTCVLYTNVGPLSHKYFYCGA